MREAELLKQFLQTKLGKEEEDEEALVTMFKNTQRQQFLKNSELDFLLEGITAKTFD